MNRATPLAFRFLTVNAVWPHALGTMPSSGDGLNSLLNKSHNKPLSP